MKILFSLFLIFVKYITFILAQNECEQISPSIIMDCSNASNSTNSCCFYKKNSVSYCKWWNSKFIGTVTNKDSLTYHCDNPKGSSCGIQSPQSARDCSKYGASTNACCLYENSTNNMKGCQWWGSGFTGNATYNGLDYTCVSNYFKYSFILIFLISLSLI